MRPYSYLYWQHFFQYHTYTKKEIDFYNGLISSFDSNYNLFIVPDELIKEHTDSYYFRNQYKTLLLSSQNKGESKVIYVTNDTTNYGSDTEPFFVIRFEEYFDINFFLANKRTYESFKPNEWIINWQSTHNKYFNMGELNYKVIKSLQNP